MIGHSAGASSMCVQLQTNAQQVLAKTIFSLVFLPPHSIRHSKTFLLIALYLSSLLSYPVVQQPDMDRSARDFMNQMVRLSSSQRDTWRSRDDAKRWLRARGPWISWDTRCIDLYVVRLPLLFHAKITTDNSPPEIRFSANINGTGPQRPTWGDFGMHQKCSDSRI